MQRYNKEEIKKKAMSFVVLIYVKKKSICVYDEHMTKIEEIIQQGDKCIDKQCCKKIKKDAGYIIIDEEKKVIINGQHAFPIRKKQGYELVNQIS